MNPMAIIAGGIGILLSYVKKRENYERKMNEKMDAIIEGHKLALREGRLLTSEI